MVGYGSARLLGSWSSGRSAYELKCVTCGKRERVSSREEALQYLDSLPNALRGPLGVARNRVGLQ
jgi:hypothetical protein